METTIKKNALPPLFGGSAFCSFFISYRLRRVEFVKPSEIAGGKGICKHEKKEEQQQVNPAEKQHRSKSPRTDPGEEPNRYHGNNGEQGGFEGKRDGDR